MARKGLARSRPIRSLVFPGTSDAHFRRNISRVDMLCMRWGDSKVCVSERPSQPTAPGTTAAAPSGVDSSVAEAPRGRHRVPSSPRGRPSGSPGLPSPLRPAASSSPSKRASGSPARRRGSPVTPAHHAWGSTLGNLRCASTVEPLRVLCSFFVNESFYTPSIVYTKFRPNVRRSDLSRINTK